MVKPVPDGYHTLTPYLIVPDAEKIIQFLHDIFGAELLERHNRPDGTLKHGEFQFGDSRIMMAQGTERYTPHPQTFYVYLDNVDVVYERALKAGAKSLAPLANQFYGDRSGGFEDPAGNCWYVATHVEDVSPEELQRRMLTQETVQK